MKDFETACKIAKDTLDLAEKDLPQDAEEDDSNRDALAIVNLLRENLELWKSESEDNN